MPCAFCGEGDRWIKTCRIKDGSRIRVCDPCWEVLSPWLVVVPGDGVVTARCDACERYFNPGEMAEFSPGGRYNAYSGTCATCAQEDAREAVVVAARVHYEGRAPSPPLSRPAP